jgi:hypothetical protein
MREDETMAILHPSVAEVVLAYQARSFTSKSVEGLAHTAALGSSGKLARGNGTVRLRHRIWATYRPEEVCRREEALTSGTSSSTGLLSSRRWT